MKIIRNYKYTFLTFTILFVVYYYYPYKIEGYGYYTKIWAHRVNSIEKLHSALNYFNGIELDLVYNAEKDFLDVNHPPTKSVGLHFEEYLKSIENKAFPNMWLDVKNLNKENSNIILKKLLLLFKNSSHSLDKVIIESKNSQELIPFENAGFKTSFYLTNELYKKNEIELSKEILKIKKVIKKQPDIAISTNFKNYEIVNREFPNHKKHIWALVKPIHFQHFKIRKILKDKSVKVVLLNYHVIKGNH